MSPVDFKKRSCRPVEFKGQGPYIYPVIYQLDRSHLPKTLKCEIDEFKEEVVHFFQIRKSPSHK